MKLLQQLGAYKHSNDRLPQRWHGVCPLHLIFRRLHSLLQAQISSSIMHRIYAGYPPCDRDVSIPLRSGLGRVVVVLALMRAARVVRGAESVATVHVRDRSHARSWRKAGVDAVEQGALKIKSRGSVRRCGGSRSSDDRHSADCGSAGKRRTSST